MDRVVGISKGEKYIAVLRDNAIYVEPNNNNITEYKKQRSFYLDFMYTFYGKIANEPSDMLYTIILNEPYRIYCDIRPFLIIYISKRTELVYYIDLTNKDNYVHFSNTEVQIHGKHYCYERGKIPSTLGISFEELTREFTTDIGKDVKDIEKILGKPIEYIHNFLSVATNDTEDYSKLVIDLSGITFENINVLDVLIENYFTFGWVTEPYMVHKIIMPSVRLKSLYCLMSPTYSAIQAHIFDFSHYISDVEDMTEIRELHKLNWVTNYDMPQILVIPKNFDNMKSILLKYNRQLKYKGIMDNDSIDNYYAKLILLNSKDKILVEV